MGKGRWGILSLSPEIWIWLSLSMFAKGPSMVSAVGDGFGLSGIEELGGMKG